jgi:hypothetical protein
MRAHLLSWRSGATTVTVSGALVAALAAGCSSGTPNRADGNVTTSTSGTSASTTEASTSTSMATGTGGLPATGKYADGPVGTPHYVLDLTESSGNTMAGSISFVFQDGRTQSEMSFSGTTSSGTATLSTSPGDRTITATYTSSSITLASCTGYLQYAQNDKECTFTPSPSG